MPDDRRPARRFRIEARRENSSRSSHCVRRAAAGISGTRRNRRPWGGAEWPCARRFFEGDGDAAWRGGHTPSRRNRRTPAPSGAQAEVGVGLGARHWAGQDRLGLEGRLPGSAFSRRLSFFTRLCSDRIRGGGYGRWVARFLRPGAGRPPAVAASSRGPPRFLGREPPDRDLRPERHQGGAAPMAPGVPAVFFPRSPASFGRAPCPSAGRLSGREAGRGRGWPGRRVPDRTIRGISGRMARSLRSGGPNGAPPSGSSLSPGPLRRRLNGRPGPPAHSERVFRVFGHRTCRSALRRVPDTSI